MGLVFLWVGVAYFFGAIPFGLLVAKFRGVDIRKHGSGNIGATNVFRCVGKGAGIFTFALDAMKGFLPAYLFWRISGLDPEWGVLFGLIAILGHSFPVYLRFKGGKGVATSAGMLLGVAPLAVGFGVVSWILCLLISRYVSLSSMIAAIVVSASAWIVYDGWVVNLALTGLAALIVWLHRANIKRLANGTENRFGKKKEAVS